MRSIRYALPLLLCLVISSAAYAQDPDRPRYRIQVMQADSSLGFIVLELYPDVAPQTVRNFDSLVAIQFYDGTAFHRVLPGSIIQGGDPNSRDQPEETWGYGDPSQRTIPAEFSDLSHTRGVISMARRGNDINSATSQFFICVGNRKDLDHSYTIFGRVVEGMNVVDAIAHTEIGENDRPVDKVEMYITKLDDIGGVGAAAARRNSLTALASPNPCNDRLTISYTLPRAGHVELALLDVMGRRISLPANEFHEAGTYHISCDLSALPTGIYAWRLTTDGEATGGTVMKVQ